MARPRKPGLSYFSLDTKFDVDMEAIISLHGATGFAVVVTLWQLCYGENGYFTRWDRSKEIVFSGKFRINPEEFRKILETAFELAIFDREKVDQFNVLTSSGIQSRYLDICQTSKRIGEIELDLMVSSRKFGVNPENSGSIPPNKRKVNKRERKPKEKKEKKTTLSPEKSGTFSEIWKEAVQLILDHKAKYQDGGDFTPADGAALKKILEQMDARVKNSEPGAAQSRTLDFLKWFMGTYETWDNFNKKSLSHIASQFENIYLFIKNGNPTGSGKGHGGPQITPGGINAEIEKRFPGIPPAG